MSFRLGFIGGFANGNPNAEGHGLDLVLPWWMGLHEGAF